MQEKIEKAKSFAFRLLSYRIRTCKEMSDKLRDKGFSQDIINRVIKDLKRIDYLNDAKFAKEFIESRLIHNPKGAKMLSYELTQKEVAKHIIDKALKENLPSEKEADLARELAKKVWLKKKNVEINKRKAQLYNYLARRGFSSSLIIKTLEEVSGQK